MTLYWSVELHSIKTISLSPFKLDLYQSLRTYHKKKSCIIQGYDEHNKTPIHASNSHNPVEGGCFYFFLASKCPWFEQGFKRKDSTHPKHLNAELFGACFIKSSLLRSYFRDKSHWDGVSWSEIHRRSLDGPWGHGGDCDQQQEETRQTAQQQDQGEVI